MGGQRLPRSVRLGGGSAFQAVFDRGRRYVGSYVVLRHLPEGDRWRVAFVAGRRLGKAVRRNRMRRRIREAFRSLRPDVPIAPGRYVFLARAGARDAPFGALREDIGRVLAAAASRSAPTAEKPGPNESVG
jgi:ribonuclease P protein component